MVRAGGGRQPEVRARVVAIALGGALGTLARYGVSRALVVGTGGFPWPTFTVNVIGSFLLAGLLTLVVERWPPTRFVRPFGAIGFCGGFTTFSTVAVEIVQRAQHGHVAMAAVYLVTSLLVGLTAAAAGITVVRGRILAVGGDRTIPDPDDLGVLFAEPTALERVDIVIEPAASGAVVDTSPAGGTAPVDDDQDPVPA